MTTELDEFVGARERSCMTCRLPQEILDVIIENEQRPPHARHSRAKVAQWVVSKGYQTSDDSLYKHFARNH